MIDRMPTPTPFFLAGLLLAASGATTAAEPCRPASVPEIAALFEHWNAALQSGQADNVMAHYAQRSVLMVPSSNAVLLSPTAKLAYYQRLIARGPAVQLSQRHIEVDCNTAVDAGAYLIRFADGTQHGADYSVTYQRFGTRWLIVSHRTSWMPAQTSSFGPPD